MSTNLRIRKTKVIATLGPACDDVAILAQMIHAGMNVARLNFSHGTHAEHAARLERLRQACERAGGTVATMLDTRGIEIRLGDFAEGHVELEVGEEFVIDPAISAGDVDGVSLNQPGLGRFLSVGEPIMLDDGAIELSVLAVAGDRLRCRVETGGLLRSRKGVNLPHTDLELQAMAPENEPDLRFAAENDMDYVAASFVRNAKDVCDLREILEANGAFIPIIAKIENRSGVANLGEIVSAADGTMVARGDLGVELPVEEVPSVQKKIIRMTVLNGKPVITATQMLDSMERNPRPTRAEASDVANAIYDGTSAVMLSGETAVGKYPVQAVSTMAKLAQQAEASLSEYGYLQHVHPDPENEVSEAVSQAAFTMAQHLHAAAIVTLTESGYTSRMISKYRPPCPILAVTSSRAVERRLCMNWGITAFYQSDEHDDDTKIGFAIDRARETGFVVPGDVVIVTAGLSQQSGTTDMIRVLTVV